MWKTKQPNFRIFRKLLQKTHCCPPAFAKPPLAAMLRPRRAAGAKPRKPRAAQWGHASWMFADLLGIVFFDFVVFSFHVFFFEVFGANITTFCNFLSILGFTTLLMDISSKIPVLRYGKVAIPMHFCWNLCNFFSISDSLKPGSHQTSSLRKFSGFITNLKACVRSIQGLLHRKLGNLSWVHRGTQRAIFSKLSKLSTERYPIQTPYSIIFPWLLTGIE